MISATEGRRSNAGSVPAFTAMGAGGYVCEEKAAPQAQGRMQVSDCGAAGPGVGRLFCVARYKGWIRLTRRSSRRLTRMLDISPTVTTFPL